MTTSGRVNTTTLDLLEANIVHLFNLEQRQPARTVLPSVAHHLNDVASALSYADSMHECTRLIFLYSQAAALAGWLELEQGGHGVHRYWSAALAAAGEIKSESLLACVQTYMSYAAETQGAPMAALHLVHSALNYAGDDQRARAWIAARAAQAAAEIGDQGTAFTHLGLAMELGSDAKPITAEDGTAPWVRFVDMAYVWGIVANTFSHMKITSDAFMAAIYARDALSAEPTKARALTLAEIAYAFAAVWQYDEAVWYANEALELAETLEAVRVGRRLNALLPLLPTPLSGTAAALAERVLRA